MRSRSTVRLALVGVASAGVVAFSPVLAHEGHSHAKSRASVATEPKSAQEDSGRRPGAVPVPVDQFLGGAIGGDFTLTDQHGNRRRRADFAGRYVLLFFGYVNCEAICSAAIPLMSQSVERLGDKGTAIDLLIITVDPDRDTPEGLRDGLKKYDDRFVGLTGSRAELEPVWKRFQITTKEVARDWLDQPVFAHGSFIYLLDPKGQVATLLPPILSAERLANIVDAYITGLPGSTSR